MDIDLDDLISTDAANTAKAGIKFQPKGKSKLKPKPKPNTQPEPKSTSTHSTQVVEVAATTKEQTLNDVNQIIGNIIDSLQSSFKNPQEENAESILTLDSPNDFLPESTATSVNLPPCSDTQTIDVSMDGKLEAGPTEPELINNIDASANLESFAMPDPLTADGTAILNDNEGFQMGNLSPGSKEAENYHFREPLDILSQSITRSGLRVGKFKPKPKAQSRKMEQIPNNPDQDLGPVQDEENICSAPSQPDFMENELTPSSTPDEILGTSSIRITDSVPTETVSDYYVNEEANKELRLIDEADNEGVDDNNNNDDYVPENESLTEKKGSKSKSKSKKSFDENKKPVRKRKKAKEVLDEITEVPKKKFLHGTRRNKRQVNPELLKIPEDEFELHMHNFPLRDLIRLREHKEKIEKKDASISETNATDQCELAENTTHYNYRTHMKITPRMKWTKLDTELFYQAIQQFGLDLSIIKECFPERTLEQIRSKYKRESKQHRLRMESALSTRAKDYSHFEFVIERLKQAQAEESDNDNPISLAGEEDEMMATHNNEGDNVKMQKEVKDMEPDVPAAAGTESPTKSDDIEDDFWSQYKSDI